MYLNWLFFLSRRSYNYLRMLVSFVAGCLVAGLLPGQALFIQMFVEYGVFASLCSEGQSMCSLQQVLVAVGFNIGMALSLLGLFPTGWMFDRYGGRYVCLLGAKLCVVGLLLLQIPLLGVAFGYDHYTSWLFPFVLCIADTGALFTAYGLYAFVYHFPDGQMLVAALGGCSQSSIPALLPNVLQCVMQWTGWALPSVFALYTCSILVSGYMLFLVLPTHDEYRSEAQRVLGMPLPEISDHPEIIRDFKRGFESFQTHCKDHMWFLAAFALFYSSVSVYQSLLGEYAEILLGTESAGNELASLYNVMQASFGTVVMIVISIWTDRLGEKALNFALRYTTFLCITITALIAIPAWTAQAFTSLFTVLVVCLTQPLAAKYSLVYCLPSRFGVFNSILFGFVCLAYIPFMIVFYAWLTFIPASQMPVQMALVFAITCVVLMLWSCRFERTGVPQHPVILPCDEEELAKPFHCKTLAEVMSLTHMENEEELIKVLCSTDQGDWEILLNRVDPPSDWTTLRLCVPFLSDHN